MVQRQQKKSFNGRRYIERRAVKMTLLIKVLGATCRRTNLAHAFATTSPCRSSHLLLGDREIRSVEAPMVAASDFAFRTLCRQYGVDLCFTQMLHARHLNNDPSFRENHLDLYECVGISDDSLPPLTAMAQSNFLNRLDRFGGQPFQDLVRAHASGPLVVQLAGHDVDQVVMAAQRLVEHTQGRISGIDLNCGCPQQIARKGNYGAFFMEADNGKAASQILRSLRQALPESVKVSTKCRLPLEDKMLRERMERLRDSGIDFITVHGRTLRENKTLTGPSNTDAIRKAVEWLDIPVVANGGVENYEDVQRVFQQTGAAAIMSSEGLLERPDLFQATATADDIRSPRDILERQFKFTRDYLFWARLFPPLPGVLGQEGGSFNIVRSVRKDLDICRARSLSQPTNQPTPFSRPFSALVQDSSSLLAGPR